MQNLLVCLTRPFWGKMLSLLDNDIQCTVCDGYTYAHTPMHTSTGRLVVGGIHVYMYLIQNWCNLHV